MPQLLPDDEAAASASKGGSEAFVRSGIATRFQPGHPGGPGRPKRRMVRALFLAALTENDAPALVKLKERIRNIIQKGTNKQVIALLELMRDEIDGKLPVKLDVGNGATRVTQFVYEGEERPAEAAAAAPPVDDGLADADGTVYEPVGEPM